MGDVSAAHERPIDTADGAFYRFLRAHGIEATTEAGRIAVRVGWLTGRITGAARPNDAS